MRPPTWLPLTVLPAAVLALSLAGCATDHTLFAEDQDEGRPGAQQGSGQAADDAGADTDGEDAPSGDSDGGSQGQGTDGGSSADGGSTGDGGYDDGGDGGDGGYGDGGYGDGGYDDSSDGGYDEADGGLDEADGGYDDGEGETEDDEGDGGAYEPYSLSVGDLVITELMIDPTAVGDSEGEWVELYNSGPSPIQLQDLVLGDDDVDAWSIEDEATVGPGEYAVLCAVAAGALNGGVSCDATFYYNTWGDGFALSNTGDEVVIATADGEIIDRVSYAEDQVVPGTALGLDPWYTDAAYNDYSDVWCDQESRMSGGDLGTPADENDVCW